VFPGGALVGCEAGTLNVARIKGSHAAIKTGMLAAEAVFAALGEGRAHDELSAYPAAFEKSWLHTELQGAKNFKSWFKKGPDHAALEPASRHAKIEYPKPDGVLSFDRLSSVFLSSTHHDEDQR